MKFDIFLKDEPLNIGIVGLGLIGGSFAKAIKHYTPHTVYGADIDAQTRERAYQEGAMDKPLDEKNISECDLLLIALYPRQAVEYVKNNLSLISPGCIVVDLCGVKQYVVNELSARCKEHDIIYIGGHPMAGREAWGFSNADHRLFKDASMILTPDENAPQEVLDLLIGLFSDIRFGRITYCTPEDHDRMIAFTSQLAHVVSSAYIKSPSAERQQGFSAGSYKDLTRVARLNSQMWTELFLENAGFLTEEINSIIKHLEQYRDAIGANDAETLYALLEDGKNKKEAHL